MNCSFLKALEQGLELSIKKLTYKENETISASCTHGYLNTNEKNLTICLKTGWQQGGNYIHCKLSSCPIPKPPQNGFIKFRLKQNIYEIFCKDGFALRGSKLIKCQYDPYQMKFLWIPEDSHCVLSFCPSPPILPEVTIQTPDQKQYREGDKIIYSCLNYNKTAESFCRNNEWTLKELTCKPSCSLAQIPDSMKLETKSGEIITKREFYSGEGFRLSCKEGFILKGSDYIVCNNSQWSEEMPLCHKAESLCLPPGFVPHADILFQNSSMISYSCRKGFRLTGINPIFCSASNQSKWSWSSPPPKCIGSKCPPPPEIPHSIVTKAKFFLEGDKVTYSCINSSKTISAVCQNSSWSIEDSSCGKNCKLPQIPNLYYNKTKLFFGEGEELEVSCTQGFTVMGASKIVCLNGKWLNPPLCKAFCDLPVIENSILKIQNSSLKVQCLEGFQISGPEEVICQYDNTLDKMIWSSNETKCLPCSFHNCKTCPPPQEFSKADLVVSKPPPFVEGDTVSYLCWESNKFASSTCKNQTWTVEDFNCDMFCSVPNNKLLVFIKNKQTTKRSKFWVGESLEVFCKFEMVLSGSSRINCTAFGWSPALPSCLKGCDLPPLMKNGRIEQLSELLVVYSCLKGFEMEGAAEIHCIDGQWLEEFPTCNPTNCPSPFTKRSSKSAEDYEPGSVLTYSCPPGKILIGSNYTVCLRNGNWKNNPPYCIKEGQSQEIIESYAMYNMLEKPEVSFELNAIHPKTSQFSWFYFVPSFAIVAFIVIIAFVTLYCACQQFSTKTGRPNYRSSNRE